MALSENELAIAGAGIHQIFEKQVQNRPDAIAVELDGNYLTYRELNHRANQVAHRLQALGVGPEIPVGIYLGRSLEMIVGMLGILKCGGVYVPLDPAYPADRLAFMLSDTQAPVLLTQESLRGGFPLAHGTHSLCLDADWPIFAHEDDQNPSNRLEPHNLAYVIYTSGSTGKPKGVCISHAAAVRHFVTMQRVLELTASDRVLAFASFSFDASLEQIFPTLYSGATVVLRGLEGWSTTEFSHQIRTLRLTVADLPTAYWDQWVQAYASDQTTHTYPFASLRLVLIGGDAVRAESVRRWQQTPLRSIRLVNAYGPTETTISATTCELTPLLRTGIPLERVPIGHPLPNRTAYILDENGVPAPEGTPGELHIGGDELARGYLNRPDLTAQRFIPDPFDGRPGARMYKTGDLVRSLSDGTIEFLGRLDGQVKIRGFRVEVGEIEERLGQHPAIKEAVVLAREDSPGDKRLVAYLVTRQPVPHRDLRTFLQETLPDYMIPNAFVFLEVLPISPNGKIDRKALPAPDHTRPDQDDTFVAPRTDTEETLARIWKEVLGVAQVGVHDAFLELGGDSLLAMRIVAQASQAGLTFTAEQIFRCKTIAELATAARPKFTTGQAEQGPVSGAVPLTPALIRYLAMPQRLAGGDIEVLSYTAPRALDPGLLERALQHVIAHHDALRLRFLHDDKGWRSVNAMWEENPVLTVVDLSQYTGAAQQAMIDSTVAKMELDLHRGPLLRAMLFIGTSGLVPYLVILIHHLVFDAYSEPILMQDLETTYLQLSQGQQPHLPAKTTSFKAWAEHLSEYAYSPELQRELDYWLSLPWDRVRHLPTAAGAADLLGQTRHINVSLGATETYALLYDAPRALNVRVYDILLAALTRVFGGWIGSETVLIRLIGHGREPLFAGADLTRTVGWFTTAFPVLLETRGTARSGETVRAVKEYMQQIPTGGVGYGILRNMGSQVTAAQINRLPQPEIHLNFHGQVGHAYAGLALFQPADEIGIEPSRPPVKTYQDLRLRAHVEDGQFHLRLAYHDRAYRRETIDGIANDVLAALREILADSRLEASPAQSNLSTHCKYGWERTDSTEWKEIVCSPTT